METKKCPKCHKVYPVTSEYFNIKRDGNLTKMCILCNDKNTEYYKQYRTEDHSDRPKRDRSIKKSRENGYEECYVCGRMYLHTTDNFMVKDNKLTHRCVSCTDDSEKYQKYLIKAREEWKRRYDKIKDTEKYKEQRREHDRKYRANNLEKVREKQNQYLREHPEKRKERKAKYAATENGHRKIRDRERRKNQKRRALRQGLESSLTAKQWEDCKSFFNGCCAYCGCDGDMTQDHFIPVINGGEYSRDNILPVCHSCNSRKQAQDFFEWYPAQLFYSKMREKRLIKYLNYKGEGLQQRTLFG